MKRDYILPNRAYDALKYVTRILIPGVGSLYFGLSDIWNLPKGAEVAATSAVIVTFLGLFLTASDASYKRSDAKFDGELEVQHSVEYLDPDDPEPAKVTSYKMVGDMTPEELGEKSKILFKVNHINK